MKRFVRLFYLLSIILIFGSSIVSAQDSQNVYRLYNKTTGEHLLTSNIQEYQELEKLGWTGEGIAWIAPLEGEAVWRFFNPTLSDHLYTYNPTEMGQIIWNGWIYDYYLPVFFSGGNVNVYRLYNPLTRRHLLTTDKNEYIILGDNGWIKEGIAMKALSLS